MGNTDRSDVGAVHRPVLGGAQLGGAGTFPAGRDAVSDASSVERTLARAKPAAAKFMRTASGAVAAAQLTTVLAAVAARDRLTIAGEAGRRGARREYQARLADVETAFARPCARLARGFRGVDFLGQPVGEDDLRQAVALGVAEAVSRYRPEKANGGAVFFVLTRVRFALQQLTGCTRKRYALVSLEDLPGDARVS